jgi:hypothetical protein
MVNCVVLFEVRAEFLSTTYTSFGFKGLTSRKLQEEDIVTAATVLTRRDLLLPSPIKSVTIKVQYTGRKCICCFIWASDVVPP